MPTLILRLEIDPSTKKKNVWVKYESDSDALPMEHEEEHKRNGQRFFAGVLSIELSLGMLPKLWAEMGEALAQSTIEAETHVRKQDVANADESGWYEGKKDERHRRARI
jgi:hypothetical protein